MIKLIASDLDGTLLNKHHTTDRYILRTIDKITQSGLVFVVATGRSMQRNQYQKIFGERELYRIVNNGALVFNPQNKVIYEKTIDTQIVSEILDRFGDHAFDFITQDITYVNGTKEKYVKHLENAYQDANPALLKAMESFIAGNQYNSSREEILSKKVIKINTRMHDESHRQAFDEYLLNQPNLINNPFSDGVYELTHKDVNKANALRFILNEMDILDDQVAVFGDGGNDIEMLSEFKYSFAPSSATPKAKDVASQVLGHYKYYAVPRKMRKIVKNGGRLR